MCAVWDQIEIKAFIISAFFENYFYGDSLLEYMNTVFQWKMTLSDVISDGGHLDSV